MNIYQNIGNWGSNRYPQTKEVGESHFLWRDGNPARQHNVNQALVETATGRVLDGEEAYNVFYDAIEAELSVVLFPPGPKRAALIVDLAQGRVSGAGYGIAPAYGDGEAFSVRSQSSRWQTSGGSSVMVDTSHTYHYVWGSDGRARFAR